MGGWRPNSGVRALHLARLHIRRYAWGFSCVFNAFKSQLLLPSTQFEARSILIRPPISNMSFKRAPSSVFSHSANGSNHAFKEEKHFSRHCSTERVCRNAFRSSWVHRNWALHTICLDAFEITSSDYFVHTDMMFGYVDHFCWRPINSALSRGVNSMAQVTWPRPRDGDKTLYAEYCTSATQTSAHSFPSWLGVASLNLTTDLYYGYESMVI